MSDLWFVIFLVLVFVAIGAGQWLAVALGGAGFLTAWVYGGFNPAIQGAGSVLFNTSTSFTFTAIPMFILMGEIIVESGLTRPFFEAISKWVGKVPGGMLHANIVTSAVFAAVTGSSAATAAAIAPVAAPELLARRYQTKTTLGSIAAGGTLGILIPPSVGMIVYGTVAQLNIATLFIAGLLPGVVAAAAFVAYLFVYGLLDKNLTPELNRVPFTEKVRSSMPIVPVAVLVLLILYVIYFGIATPTEAAAIGSLVAVVIGATVGKLRWQGFVEASVRAVRTTAMVLFIMVGAQMFSFGLVSAGINNTLIQWIGASHVSAFDVFVFVVVLYLALGCFLDGISMLLLTLPVLYPIILAVGINPIVFGVIAMIMIEVGGITPPVGINLFIVQSAAPREKLSTVVYGSMPFAVIFLAVAVAVWLLPGISLLLTTGMH